MAERIEHNDFYFVLGDVLRHFRKDANITKTNMANAIGVSLPKYIAMEEGIEEIAAYELYLFARRAGINLDVIFAMLSQRFDE